MLRSIAGGLSNAELAKEAFVSETIVKTNVARILRKLRLRDIACRPSCSRASTVS
jgi:DNA-binding NarL/FixJ family response regulator